MSAPTLSVLIPTLGRSDELINTLQDLLKQTHKPDEIIIMDQNDPPLPSVCEFVRQHPQIRHITGVSPGVAVNYNRLLQAARSEVVLYLDDDMKLSDGLVAAHLKHYAQFEDRPGTLGGVAGRMQQPENDLPPEKISEVGRYHALSGRVIGNFNYDRLKQVELAPGGNMSFYKKALEKAGGFDENFSGNGYFFESDMSLRVHRLGFLIVFDPEAHNIHLRAPRGGCRVDDKAVHTRYFIQNGTRLFRRHSPAWALPLHVLRSLTYLISKAVYNLNLRIFTEGLGGLSHGLRQKI